MLLGQVGWFVITREWSCVFNVVVWVLYTVIVVTFSLWIVELLTRTSLPDPIAGQTYI